MRLCTRSGPVQVPCRDELLLEPSDRFLLTPLTGHGCYSIDISAQFPFDAFLYDSTSTLDDSRLVLEINHCDPTPIWLFLGVIITGIGGFLTMLTVLCLLGEYLCNLRPFSRFRHKLQGFQQIELARLDSSEEEGSDQDEDAAAAAAGDDFQCDGKATGNAGQDPAASA
ncbi:hypothetical protein ATCC90586_000968 [Pythium insidiosum]|nr:hypothetical protein ATCC90586_000968 [Pythium insidiosum]